MIQRVVLVIFGLIAVSAWPALAESASTLDEVTLAYEQGQYDNAVALGEELGTAEAYALAARALLGKINLQTRDEREMDEIERAIVLAEKALALDPDLVEGHLQIATAYGFKARMLNMLRAKLAKLPEKSRHHLEQTILLEPKNAWGWSFMGAWHWEVVRKGGEGMAEAMFGATMDEGSMAFEKALILDLENPYLPYLYALTLLTRDIYTYENKARDLLEVTISMESTSHQSKMTIKRAEALLATLDAKEYGSALEQVADYQGLKPLKLPKRAS